MPSSTLTYTLYNITGSYNGIFTITDSFEVVVFDSDDDFGVGDDQSGGGSTSETGAAAVIQSMGPGAPSNWQVGDTFYFGGARGVDTTGGEPDFLIVKVAGSWTNSIAWHQDASTQPVVGQTYTSNLTVDDTNVPGEVLPYAPCFTPGTMILTEQGERRIESLKAGDRIVTRDNGVQTLQWIAKREISSQELSASPKLRPVLIGSKLIGSSAPILVSPQHGVLLQSEGQDEVLVRAIHLARLDGGAARVANGVGEVVYIHLMFDAHQIVFANGAPSESFYPGPFALGALSIPARDELQALFPDLFKMDAEDAFGAKVRDFARYRSLPSHLNDLRAA